MAMVGAARRKLSKAFMTFRHQCLSRCEGDSGGKGHSMTWHTPADVMAMTRCIPQILPPAKAAHEEQCALLFERVGAFAQEVPAQTMLA